MAQKTNLNVSPYFDDFSEKDSGAKDKNYYKVLFNPGKPIQARELNTLQSILQNQIETFGSHIFKEGSLVIPGNISFDDQFCAIKLNPQQYAVDITSYLTRFVGKKIIGQISGISANVQFVQLPNSEVEYPTLYVKYLDSDSNFEINPFQDNEPLYTLETVGSIISGTPFATTISKDASATGSAASIGEGVYFIRGTFVRVPKQTIILDYYTNNPSYRVGLKIDEQIITAKNDTTLYDNAKGFTNYAAPGADRFKISLTLNKKLLTDTNDTDFVELLRVRDGAIQKIELKSSYSLIRDYLAQRTYDESGDYSVVPFQISINNSLNNRLGNDGLFFDTEKTNEENTPTDDLMCVKISPGKAYVRGYDIEKTGIEILDVNKPRTTQNIPSVNIPFQMGNLLRVNNVSGSPKQKGIIYFQNRRKNSTSTANGSTIGSARVYSFNLTDASYSGNLTNWDLYLYDVQTYTELTLNQVVSSVEIPATSYVKGVNSGASGYVVSAGSGTNKINIRQTSGTFSLGEPISINGVQLYPRTIASIKVYGIEDIKSVYQPTSISGFTIPFISDTQLDRIPRSEVITITAESSGISTATVAAPGTFSGIKTDTIIRYQRSGISTEVYNRVISISPGLNSLTLEAVDGVQGVCDGSLPASTFSGSYSLGIPKVRDNENGFLYADLPNPNVSSVNLSNSTITFSAQTNASFNPTPSSNTLTVNTGNFNLGINSTSVNFEAYDEERYAIFYNDGTVENLTPDKVKLSLNSTEVTFSNIQNKQISVINATFVKYGIQSKIKQFNRSKLIDIVYSKNPQSGTGINTSINDGLTYNPYYGLRVQDEEISLNYPDVSKVIAVYESLNTSAPVLDQITFSSIVNVNNNAIVGENIIGRDSNTVARIVTKPGSNTLGVVYLNKNRFSSNEFVIFEESNIQTTINSITPGNYRDVSSKFNLDKGQKEQYYDYSRLIRKNGESSPLKRLLVIFDYYSVSSGDSGDVFTVNSYSEERFSSDIPNIGKRNVRASDTLDFRPVVSNFTGASSSPFDFSSRTFGSEPKIIMSPNENALIGYDFYLGRIDKLVLDKLGNFVILQGTPSTNPKSPNKSDEVMELASIFLPPYLYDPKTAQISLVDNKRYTMRDIGKLEDRVENLERVTSLSLLELNTQTLQIRDAQGLNRFKTGFFVDDFKNANLINRDFSSSEIDSKNSELRPLRSNNSLDLKLVSAENINDEDLDPDENFALFDSNVQKTGDVVTLKYDSVNWIEQTFATRVENVNPFNVISYSGTIKLNPSSDSWVRTIRLSDAFIDKINRIRTGARPRSSFQVPSFNNFLFWLFGGVAAVRSNNRTNGGSGGNIGRTTPTDDSNRDAVEISFKEDKTQRVGSEDYMRSRNTGFVATNLKPFTKVYQFLDGNSGVDFIPKLIEIAVDSNLQNYGASGAFEVGETVVGTFGGKNLIRFRVAKSNHKEGRFDNPKIVYTSNPYLNSENVPENYSASSKILNVDIESLASGVLEIYSGYLKVGMKLVGQTSKTEAYVKDLRLITDINGFLAGSFFLQDPNTDPAPAVRIQTGSKVFKLTSSSTNSSPVPGSTLICSGETIYKSEGKWEEKQKIFNRTRTIVTYCDPLAQSFTVGGSTEDLNGNKPDEDANGVYLTAVDLFFYNKDSNNAPLTVEVRTMELGTPTKTIIGNPVILNPSDISTSSDASVATKVTFDYPIYLPPGLEYAIVLLAPQSDQYEVWIAEMGEKTIETSTLPDSQVQRYSKQFSIGSLFKSQNGSIWTANQYQDMKFKLYKAKFTSQSGSVLFHNPILSELPEYNTLEPNPITVLPKKVTLGITTITSSEVVGILTTGRKISEASKTYNYGYIIGTGSSVASVNLTDAGFNYSNGTVETYNLTGNGSGLKLTITTGTGGTVTAASVTSNYLGHGYRIGDVVGIVTSTVSPVGGSGARITITDIGNTVDTLYLSNVQGFQDFTPGGTLVYYNSLGNPVSMAGTTILSCTPEGGIYSGNFFKVDQFEHGMYSSSNKVTISGVESDIEPTTLSERMTATSVNISVASTENFGSFEGKPVNNTNPGYVKIGNEIIEYNSVSTGVLNVYNRGFESTNAVNHDVGTQVYKYEVGGISLRRINTTHNVSNTDIDSYYVGVDRSNTSGLDRTTDNSPSGYPEVSFNNEISCGGNIVKATKNIQFDSVIPHVSLTSPGSLTSVSAQVRTVSGTSVNGSEIPFSDKGYESVELGVENKLDSTRIVCSNVNEQQYLGSLLRNKSFTMKVDLSTSNQNLSPMIFWKESSSEFVRNRLNSPIQDYSVDSRVNSIFQDPHAAVYVSNTVLLSNPATSLKVILSAYRHETADFRVLYSLVRPDSSEVTPSFELFPGYNNLTIDNNQDGYLDVIDPSKNNGLPDVFVPASLENEFLEYEFSANNLGSFIGYTIKIVISGTNEAYVPRFKDLRSIALA
jgi:hypothetical protein